MLRDEPEKRRHDAKAEIRKCELEAHHRLGALPAEKVGRHMHDAGINGRAADADYKEARECRYAERQKHHKHAERYNAHSHTDKRAVAELHCEKAVYGSAESYSDVEKACEAGSDLGLDPAVFNEVRACPERSADLERAVSEKGDKAGYCAGHAEYFAEAKRL